MADNPRIEDLRRRVQADPASIAFAALAEEYRRTGRYDEAVETCRAGLQRHPAYLSARVTLGRALIEIGDFDAAREELDTVLRSAPENLAAIRGLEHISERLGHSAEMDPHIADIMKTMHAESIAAAALAPPPPPLPPPLPPPAQAPEPAVTMAPVAHQPTIDAPPVEERAAPAEEAPAADVFAGFAETARPASSPDYSFDLSTAFSIQTDAPMARPDEAPVDLSIDSEVSAAPPAFIEVVADPWTQLPGPEQPGQLEESEVSLDDTLDAPGGDAGLAAVHPPDPAVLATLARLERFLSAIESLRA